MNRFFALAMIAAMAMVLIDVAAGNIEKCYNFNKDTKKLEEETCGNNHDACGYAVVGKKEATGCATKPDGLDGDGCTKDVTKAEGRKRREANMIGGVAEAGNAMANAKYCFCDKKKCNKYDPNGQIQQKSSMLVIVGAILVSFLAKM